MVVYIAKLVIKNKNKKCANEHYILFTTEQQAKMCELMGCYEVGKDDCN